MKPKETTGAENNLPTTIQTDVEVIKKLFGRRLRSLAVFGSCVRSGFHKARDIDMALLMNDDSMTTIEAKRRLITLNLSFPLRGENIEENYSGGGGYLPQKEYHIIILTPGHRSQRFFSRHRSYLRFM